MSDEPEKQEESRNPDGTFKQGVSGNPNGRPKGKTMKEFAREFLSNLTDEQKASWLDRINPDTIWKMAEGNPAQDLTSGGEKIQQVPIYGSNSVQGHNSDQKDIQPDQTNPGS